MNSKLKLSALFLACSLALTGCGGSSSDKGSNAGNGGSVVSEQDVAKGFVNTLNTMISGVQNIDANYKQVTNLSNNMSNLSLAVSFPFLCWASILFSPPPFNASLFLLSSK